VRSRWDPPYLAYFELGADLTSVKLINLASFQRVVDKNGILDSFKVTGGDDGLDQNGDGDFCDPGDRPPTPDGDPFIPPGLAFSVAPHDPLERLIDFDFNSGLGVIFAISSFAANDQPARFHTMLSAGETNNLDNAFITFTNSQPKRMIFLPAVSLEGPTNRIVRDIAVVSLAQTTPDGALEIIDVSTPSAPKFLNQFTLPKGEGTPASIERRDDGLLALTTSQSTLLLDPQKLNLTSQDKAHPSIVGRIPTPGTGVRDFVADPTGINVTYGGASRKFVETAPRFSFVRFNAVVNPNDIAAQPASITAGFLKSATPVQVAEIMQPPNGGPAATPDPSRHYYVLADIPGGAADDNGKLPMALSAVDVNGMPEPEIGGTPAPAIVGDDQLNSALLARRVINLFFVVANVEKVATDAAAAQGLIGKIRAAFGVAKIAKKLVAKLSDLGKQIQLMPDQFVARRLSDNPDDPLYNKFLAGPFVLLGGAPSIDDLTRLHDQANSLGFDRAYLRPAPRLWAGLPSERMGGLLSSISPFNPPPSKLLPFVSQLSLNPNVQIAGVTIPRSGDIINEMARLNASPSNPITSFFSFAEQITLLVSVLNNVPVLSSVVKGDWQPMLIPGAHGLLRVNYNERPMILVPGFAGSQLEINQNNEWLGLFHALGDSNRFVLRIKPDGSPTNTTYATDAVRFTLETPVSLGSIYGDWIQHLTDELGLTEYNFRKDDLGFALSGPDVTNRLSLKGAPNLSQTPVPNLFVFPYDWRLDNQKAAEALREYVRLALEIHPDADGIDLVAHSNGGLVSRAYMLLKDQRALVKRFVTVGTPWLGAPKALSGMRTGDINEATINVLVPIPAVRAMLQFSPGAHQLLPSKEYFDLGYRPLIEDGFDINTNGLPNEVFDFNGYMEVMAKQFFRKPLIELGLTNGLPGDHPVRANANGFRLTQPIGDHSQDATDVEVHHIMGMSAVPNTIGQIRVRGRLVPETNKTDVVVSFARVAMRDTEEVRDGPDAMITPKSGKLAVNETNQFRMNEEIELRYVSGDGTVPIGSLVRGFGSDHDLNAKNAKLHPLVGGLEDDFTGHNPMLNSDEFFKIFDDIYVERPTTNITLSVSAGNFSEGSVGTVTVTGTLPSGASGEIDYVVDYGDGAVDRKSGNNGQAVPAQHRYRQSGVYNVTVGAAGAGQVYGVTSKTVTVQNQPPTVTIAGVEPTVNIGESRIAVAEVRDPGLDDRHTFVWSTPDGSAAKLDQFAIPITFNTAGPQVISVTVTDTDGATGTASFNVNVLPTPSTAVGANFGVDPAAQNSSPPAPLARAPIDGFDGGHPEIIVRFNGHAPSPLNTVGISVRQEGIVSAVVTAAAGAALGGVFDLFGLADPVSDLRSFPDRIILPRVARHLGQIAEETEYARLVRELPDELLSIDLAATNGLVAADGRGRPFEADVLYLEGGTPKILQRWKVPNVDTNEGVRLHFDWINQTGVVERVTANTTISPLNGSALETIPPIYYGVGEAKAADRIGPVTLGILNPATDLVHLLARDNITPGTNVTLYAVFDANENGRFDDDVFYPLDTNVVEYARLPQRPFAIVGVDEEGNVGKLDPFTIVETRNFLVDKKDGDPKTEYEHKLDDIRAAIRNGIKAGFQNGQVQKYLLDPTDLWVFEQGSGANLWKPNFRDSCNGIYLPGKSDNDYELFLPVELAHPYTFDAAGRAQFISDGPFETSTLQGDWYFKRPIGFDAAGNATQDDNSIVEWEYQVPSGFLSLGQSSFRVTRTTDDGDLSAGFHSPFTPAEIIARSFTLTITTDPTLRAQLPDTTFFPERREHFMFGRLHLERPPAFGDDPVGDAGMGRQMLLLKWLIEGAYVTPDDNGGPNSLSLTAPSLLDIYLNWQQSGVPVAEGFEWGVFQDFAALKSKPFQNFTVHYSAGGATDDPRMTAQFNDDAVREQQASRIKKLGKAAIRATLARIAGDTNFNSLLTTIPSATIANNPSRSFEGFILDLARSQASSAFGDFATDRPDDTQPPDLGDFLRAKNADKNYLKTIVTTPGAYERYVTTVFEFLRNVVQTPTRANYKAYLDDLRQHGEASELFRRQENFNIVVFGQGVGHPGLIELDADRTVSVVEPPLAAEFYSADTNAVQAQVSITRPGGTNGPAPLFFKKKQTVVAASPPSPGGPTTITGFADDDDTVVDASPVIETSDAETVTEATIVDGVPFETQEDNTIEVDAVPLDLSIPAPAVSDDPVMVALIQPDHGQDVFVLDDWPATQTQGRSPRYYLRKSDKLIVEVLAKPGLPPFNLAVTSESDPLGRTVSLQSSHGLGVYDNSDPAAVIQFTNLNDTQNADRIYVKDEELVTIEVNGNGFQQKIDVMVDLGELSLATLTHADRTVEQKPRFDYVIRFFGATSDDFAFFNDGFTQFPDDVAASVNGGDNPMRQFIQHFADNTPAFADVGEADILYVHAHGNTAGQLFDHITNNAPAGTRKLVLDPVFHLTPDGLWRTDAEWAILDACSTLNPVVTPELLNAGFQPGKERWETVLTNSNGSPGRRLPHGILGFHKTKPSLAAPHRLFMNLLEQGSALVDAWEKAMDDFQMPWAISCYKSALADNIREISQDPAPGDRLVYLESTGVLTDLGCEDCGGFFEDDEAFESISTLPVEAPEDWARGEQVLRANGYDPNDLWRLGVSEETETSFAANSVPQRKRVARAYHWEKALRDNSLEGSHVVVRISEGGAVRIIDSARNLTTGGRR
jgi:pimeloyl-ACP methyl ester carboxylesterase